MDKTAEYLKNKILTEYTTCYDTKGTFDYWTGYLDCARNAKLITEDEHITLMKINKQKSEE